MGQTLTDDVINFLPRLANNCYLVCVYLDFQIYLLYSLLKKVFIPSV